MQDEVTYAEGIGKGKNASKKEASKLALQQLYSENQQEINEFIKKKLKKNTTTKTKKVANLNLQKLKQWDMKNKHMLKNPLQSLAKMELNNNVKFIWKVKEIHDEVELSKGNNFLIVIRYGNSSSMIKAKSQLKVSDLIYSILQCDFCTSNHSSCQGK